MVNEAIENALAIDRNNTLFRSWAVDEGKVVVIVNATYDWHLEPGAFPHLISLDEAGKPKLATIYNATPDDIARILGEAGVTVTEWLPFEEAAAGASGAKSPSPPLKG